MATASQFSIDITNVGVSAVVPDDDVARLMYYLNCVTVGVGLDILEDDLVNFKNYMRLSPARRALVFKAALQLSPDEFIDKLIFRDDDGDVTGTSNNMFCNVSVACNIVSLQEDVIIAGQMQNVNKVMFFKSSWLDYFYIRPIARSVLDTQHCAHCLGRDGLCACDSCPRSSDSQCHPSLNFLIDTLTRTAISTPSLPSTPVASAKSPTSHQCICDGCGRKPEHFKGTRYRCAVCKDYDLCEACYRKNLHDSSHQFMQIDRLGSLPTGLAPRTRPQAITVTPAHRPSSPATALPGPNPSSHASATSSKTASPCFYNDMTVSELRKYLRECGVAYQDILDRETLCRRAWETHCECMSMPELKAFLKENNISTFCCSVASCRQKVKEAFQINRPAVPKNVQKHDVVMLTRLNRVEMNGKLVKVVQPDCGGGRVEVCLEESGKTFKLKLENLVVMRDDGLGEELN